MLQVNSLELKTNLLAAYVSAGLSAQLPELMRQLGIKPRDSFEIAFNRCGLL
jgi:signal recognition particle subunit SRP72